MADVVASVPKRRGLFRKLLWVFLALILLLVGLYFVATSSAFFKGVILPRVSKSLNAEVTVADASISPFSSVILHQVKIQTTGPEPLLTAAEVRLVYHLGDILHGNYHVEEAVVTSPTIEIVQNPDGTSNLDPLSKSSEKQPTKPSQPSKPSEPAKIDIKKIALSNATIRMVKNYKGGSRDLTEVSGANLTIDNLKNGQTAKMTLAGNLTLDNHPPAPATNAMLQSALAGDFAITPSVDLKSASINGKAHMDVQKTAGSFSDLNALTATVDCDINPTDIKQLALRFQKAGNNLGELRVTGPFDMAKTEGHLKVEVLALDRNVLNLAGAKSGIDFGSTLINSTNQVDLARGGREVSLQGVFNAAKLRLTRAGQTTPTLDLSSDYNLTVDRSNSLAIIKTLNLNGSQNQRPFLHGELTSPMNVSWGNVTSPVGDSALKLNVTRLNLAEWRPFIGDQLVNGTLNLTANVLSQQAGKQLTFDVSSDTTSIELQLGTNHVTQTDIHFQTKGLAVDLAQFNLQELGMKLNHQGQTVLSFNGVGQYNATNQAADMEISLNGSMPGLVDELAAPDKKATSGTLELKGRILQSGTTKSLTGNLTLANFTGKLGTSAFNNFGSTMDLDVGLNQNVLQIRKAAGSVRQGQTPSGSFDVTGNYDQDKQVGQFALKLIDFNENALRPFLASALGDKRLESISINATASAGYNAQADSSVKADFQLANLVVSDPKQQAPKTPLEAKFQVDASLKNKIADIRQFQLALTPTERAKNELALTGQVDMSQTNAMQGNFKLTSQALDVTRYYDLFADKNAEAAKPASTASPGPVSAPQSASNTEPAAVNLPLRNSSLEVNIARFYLREVEVTNLQTTAKIDGGHVLLKPFQLAMNGAPVNATADLNLGVPGYQYDLSFTADKIPLAPLANSFSAKYKDKAKGDLLANFQFKGAGVTGINLQKNLSGQFSICFTNAVIQVSDNWLYKNVLSYVALALKVPQLTNSPINYLLANGKAGDGQLNLSQFRVLSEAFVVQSQGIIPIAPILTNSPINNWPMELSLRRSIAQQARILPANAPTNTDYYQLPTFVTVQGTIGKPDPKINTVAVGKMILDATGVSQKLGKEADKLVPGLGNLLGGKPGTNQTSGGNVLGNILSGITAGKTNRPPAGNNPPPATNKPSSGNLFDLLPKAVPK